MHIKHSRILLFFFSALITNAFAQVSQVRYEIPLQGFHNEPYKTVSLKEEGIVLYGLFIGKEGNAIEIQRVDTALHQVWRGFISVPKNVYLAASLHQGRFVHLLLKDRFNPLAEFIVLSVQVSNGSWVSRNVKTMLAMQPTHFVVTETACLIGGYFNYRPLVLYYNFALDQSRILPGFFNEAGEIDQISADPAGNIDVIVSGKFISKRRSLVLRNYDKNGDLVKTIFLQPKDENVNLIFGRSMAQPDGEQIVCGVYGRYTEYSRGIFIAKIDAYGEYQIKLYNYGELKRFFSYMKAKREKRVKDRIERKRVKGRKIKFNYRLMVNEFMPYGDQFIMLGEAFYPHYSYPSNRYNPGAVYINRNVLSPSYRGDLVFDGYQYTHAVVIGFDKDGNLKWDNSFEINDIRTMQLEQFVKIHPDKDKVSLLYLFDNVIRSKVIKDYDVVEGKSYDPIQTGSSEEYVREKDTQSTKLEYWYGNVFFATGIQHLRNRQVKSENYARKVFFINKIDYK